MDDIQQTDTTGPVEGEQPQPAESQRTEAGLLLDELRQERAALLLERRLLESVLPAVAQQSLRERFAGQRGKRIERKSRRIRDCSRLSLHAVVIAYFGRKEN